VRVLNVLTAPTATSSINIILAVRGADNLEFANPCNPPQNLSTFAPQSCERDGTPRPKRLLPWRRSLPSPPMQRRSALLSPGVWHEQVSWWNRVRKDSDRPSRIASAIACVWSPCCANDVDEVLIPQSKVSDPFGEMCQDLLAGQIREPDPNRFKTNWGECIASLRVILRRFDLSYVWMNNTDPNLVISLGVQRQSKYPLYYGFDPNGIHSAKGLVVPASNFAFNYVNVLPYHLIAPCFVAQRGSMNWSFNTDGANSIRSIKMVRLPQLSGSFSNTNYSQASGSDSANSAFYRLRADPGCAGQVLTNQDTNAGLNVALPNYNPFRWQNTAPANVSGPSSFDASAYDFSQLEVSFNTGARNIQTKIWKSVGIGTDWGCYFFVNVPTYYIYSATPTPN